MEWDKPCLGIFWYDVNTRMLCGVHKAYEDEVVPDYSGHRVFPILHRDIWDEMHNYYYNEYNEYLPTDEYPDEQYNPFANPDYTQVPRGRVSSDDEGYSVFVGDWMTQSSDYEHIKELILQEFFLFDDETNFIDDIHWHIGHGWSE